MSEDIERLQQLAFSPDNTLRNIGTHFPVHRQKEILKLISRGVSITSASKMVGIGKDLYYDYKNTGKKFISDVDAGNPVEATDRIIACVNFYYNAERAEAAFEAKLDLEIDKRIDDMEDRDLIRMRELRGGWGAGKTKQDITINNINAPNASTISFSREELSQADTALIEAGIIEAEIVKEDCEDSDG